MKLRLAYGKGQRRDRAAARGERRPAEILNALLGARNDSDYTHYLGHLVQDYALPIHPSELILWLEESGFGSTLEAAVRDHAQAGAFSFGLALPLTHVRFLPSGVVGAGV